MPHRPTEERLSDPWTADRSHEAVGEDSARAGGQSGGVSRREREQRRRARARDRRRRAMAAGAAVGAGFLVLVAVVFGIRAVVSAAGRAGDERSSKGASAESSATPGRDDAGTDDVPAVEALGPPAPSAERASTEPSDGVLVTSFLGGSTRHYYGTGPVPETLDLIWRAHIGSGQTSGKGGAVTWSGTGWTGQPSLVREGGRTYVVIGGFDHNLHKIDAETGEVVWEYAFDDVIKGTNTVLWPEPDPGQAAGATPTAEIAGPIVVCGSRRGFPMSMGNAAIAPVRAVALDDGTEQWRLPTPRTRSYSQDADGSGLYVNGILYQPAETAVVYALDPWDTVPLSGGFVRPSILFQSPTLYTAEDAASHGGNLVLESSPVWHMGRIYIAAGSGHVYGLDPEDLSIEWDYVTGSDMDGSVISLHDGCILASVEKQYIPGKGGVLKLDPTKPPAEAVEWFFPTGDRAFADWQGGVIGSAAVNDEYDPAREKPALAAFSAIDGNLYVVSQEVTTGVTMGPREKGEVPTPALVFKDNIGGAISSPIFVGDHIVAAGYDAKVHVYRVDYDAPDAKESVDLPTRDGARTVSVSVREVATFDGGGAFESTPVVWRGRIYIGSRDGYLYCLGDASAVSTQ